MAKYILQVMLLLVTLLNLTTATIVEPCTTASFYDHPVFNAYNSTYLSQRVKISGCDASPCYVMKDSLYPTTIKFRPNRDVQTILDMASVSTGIAMDYPGMIFKDVCKFIYLPNGEKHGCPLKANEEYVYKKPFNTAYIGVNIPIEFRWALMDKDSKDDQMCFKFTVRVSRKKIFGIET